MDLYNFHLNAPELDRAKLSFTTALKNRSAMTIFNKDHIEDMNIKKV